MNKQPTAADRFARTCGAVALAASALGAFACGPVPDYRRLVDLDLRPPVFMGAEGVSSRTMVLRFDESVSVVPDSVSISPALPIGGAATSGQEVVISLGADQASGVDYVVGVAVEDAHRNSVSVLSHVYGYNPRVPRLVINELLNRGSGTHPDLVELYVVEGGNTAGVCLFEGSCSNWDERLVLPPIEVRDGDYILAHWKPQGIPEERTETTDRSESGGLDASSSAWDVWLKGGNGLGGNNGVLSLYASPNGKLLDAVAFSNRTSASDDNYDGFGSAAMLAQITEVVAAGGWRCAGAKPAPEDCVNPDGATSTRSLGRDSRSTDSDSASDWHIVPTKRATFGAANSDERYTPAQ